MLDLLFIAALILFSRNELMSLRYLNTSTDTSQAGVVNASIVTPFMLLKKA